MADVKNQNIEIVANALLAALRKHADGDGQGWVEASEANPDDLSNMRIDARFDLRAVAREMLDHVFLADD